MYIIVKTSPMPGVGGVCESEKLLGTSNSASPDANTQISQGVEDVLVKKENEEDESSSGSDSEVFLTCNL